jgi:hypothetical protein
MSPRSVAFFTRQTKKENPNGFLFCFAGDRTRTSALLLDVDFESTASTNFATLANLKGKL